jgi:hypothetical protein
MLSQVFTYLNNEIDSIIKNHQEFGYRERMQIERGLFLLIKLLCSERLKYNLQGFSKNHKDNILKIISQDKCAISFTQLVDRIFQLKVFLLSLSSENAYVRGDALSRMGLKRQNVFSFIKDEIGRIRSKVTDLNIENTRIIDRHKNC